ncbi:MAG: hypothetical protein IJE16_00195 [Ruminococcus sp.]|nr:hypothetical protein [Ruminococcus sp.]
MNTPINHKETLKILDELSNEYRNILLKILVEQSPSVDDISISKILRIDNKIKRQLINYYKPEKRISKRLFIFGSAYIFIGIITLVIYSVISADKLHSTQGGLLLFSLIISIFGLIASVYSTIITKKDYTYAIKLKTINQPKDIKLLSFEVVSKWRELEGIVADLSEINPNPKSRSIIEYLLYNNLIKEEEANVLKNFLKIRNSIVHASEMTVSYDDMKKILDEVNIITEKLNDII